MEDALKTLARGEAILPQRPSIWLPDKSGQLVMMPTYLRAEHKRPWTQSNHVLSRKHEQSLRYPPGQSDALRHDNGNLLAMIDTSE